MVGPFSIGLSINVVSAKLVLIHFLIGHMDDAAISSGDPEDAVSASFPSPVWIRVTIKRPIRFWKRCLISVLPECPKIDRSDWPVHVYPCFWKNPVTGLGPVIRKDSGTRIASWIAKTVAR